MLRKNQKFLSQLYMLFDFIIILAAFFASWWLRFQSGLLASENVLPFSVYFQWAAIYAVVAIVTGFFLNFYVPKRKKNFSYEFVKIIQVQFISLLVLLGFLYIWKEVHISRTFLALFVLISILLLSAYRLTVKLMLYHFRKQGYNKQFVLIIGAGDLGRLFYKNLLQYPELGYEVIGFLDDMQTSHSPEYAKYKPILGKIDQLEEILGRYLVDEVVVALPISEHEKFARIIELCEKAGTKVMLIPDFFDILPSRPVFDQFAGLPLIRVRDIPLDELRNRFLKRAFDIVFSLFAIIITLPLLILIAVGIKLTSPGPVIFKQQRVGLNRRPFTMYKFRTMRVMPQEQSDTGWTVENDPRRTKFGAFLRKTSLDELPQFFNVLKGDMSIVGPRPERPYFVEQFKEQIPQYMLKHFIRPGITGWAQVNGLRGDTSIQERIRYDLFYIENWSLIFDLKIVLKTIVKGFVNRNAY